MFVPAVVTAGGSHLGNSRTTRTAAGEPKGPIVGGAGVTPSLVTSYPAVIVAWIVDAMSMLADWAVLLIA